jgi:hypothetical protein
VLDTPELQVKLYAGVTGVKQNYTAELQVKLYAGVTGKAVKSFTGRIYVPYNRKTIRRSYR